MSFQRRFFSSAGFLAVLALVAALAAGPVRADPGGPMLGEREVLPNGLVWQFSEQRSVPIVVVNLLVKAGSLRDPAGHAGLANLTALLLTQGTKRRSAAQMAAEIDALGARLSSHGDEDFAMVSLTVLRKDVGEGFDLLADAVLNPTFPAEELRRKVSQLKASFETDEDEPMVIARRAFDLRLFGTHPYAFPPKGTPQSMTAVSRQKVVDFHRTFYRPNNAILTVVGDISRDEARDWVMKAFGRWEKRAIPELKLPALPTLSQAETRVIDKKITQANIIWGHVGIARNNPDFYAFQVMNYILGGGGFASRLMDNIRETRGLAYSVGSSFEAGLEPGPFIISLETKNASAGEAVAQILQELERLRSQPVSPTELAEAKSYLIGSFPRKMDATGKRASLMAYVEFYGLGLDYPWRYPSFIQNLTAADIQQAAKNYLHPDRSLLVVVGNQSQLPPLPGVSVTPHAKEKKDATK